MSGFRTLGFAAVVVGALITWQVVAHAEEDHGATKNAAANAEHANHAEQTRIGDVYPLLTDPVSDEPLAKVDKPIVVIHHGRDLRFANAANVEKFNADPDMYLAKVDAMIIAQQKPLYPLSTCMVSGEKLDGDMGAPVDLVYGNRLVRFCCKSCLGDFKKDPAKYLATLDAAVIEAQKKDYPLTQCMISGDKFGGDMGDPVDYVVGNRLVRFCCKDCVTMFEKNPAKYLSRLDAHTPAKDGEHADHHEGAADKADKHDEHKHEHQH